MNGDYERVDWEDAVSTGRGPERNTDIYDGQVEWDSTVKEVRGVRHAGKEIKRAVFGDSAGTVRDTRARGTSVRRASRKGPPKIVVDLGLLLLGLLAYSGVFGLGALYLGGLFLVATVKVSVITRIILIVLVIPTLPLMLTPVVLHQMLCDRLR